MKERPILFSGAMVNAILEGRKTQTRRVVKPQPTLPYAWHGCWDGTQFWTDNKTQGEKGDTEYRAVPYGTVGDRLWVRETWRGEQDNVNYRASTNNHGPADGSADSESKNWRPSIFMPRWASRITLEVTGVRVERVQDISEADARAEGVKVAPVQMWRPLGSKEPHQPYTHYQAFGALWDSINAKRGYEWDDNPWVWVVEFKRI